MREDWVECKLGDLITLKNGFAFKSDKYTDEGIPVLRIGDINDFKAVTTKAQRVIENAEYDDYVVNKGDILIAMSGATTGKFGVYNSNEKAYQNQRVGNLIPNSKRFLDKNFIFYLLYSLKREIEKQAYGGAQPNISAKKIEELDTILAPLPIQRAIVQKIESYFDLLNKGIAELKTAQEQLKIYRQAVLKKAFEGEFTATAYNRKDRVCPVSKEENNLPKGWKWVKLKEVAEINPKLPNKEEIDSLLEVQFLPMKLVEEEINKIHLIETKLFHEVQKGSYTPFIENDVIFAKVTPCMENGKIAIMKNLKNEIGYGSSEFHVIRCKNDVLNTYVFHYVVQAKFRKEAEMQMTGAVGLRRVPKKFLEDYQIPLPPTLNEQHAIVREIESRLSVCDKVEESISESLEKAEALRQSILKKAFEGKLLSEEEIAKCKQETDYEPASVLLERIKKEKN
ncbi:MAG: restriction endonuclease subunit S [Petrimonas sp.]|jgi:type I restriction enzyme S subunit|nr:restriction endonuclease subunit S [Bacteroidales bacterium]